MSDDKEGTFAGDLDYMQIRPSTIRHLEALLFSAGEPLAPEDILSILSESVEPEMTLSQLDDALEALREHLDNEDHTFQLQLTGGGWQLLTKPAYYPTLSKYFKQQSGKRLSKAALETLSIVAYRQPVTRADVEAVRGVGSDYAINKLLERELITILGRDQGPGRPLLYATSPQFMDYFGLADISDLPKLRELVPPDNSIGEVPDITEPTALLQQKIDAAHVTINNEAGTDEKFTEVIAAATSIAVVAEVFGFEEVPTKLALQEEAEPIVAQAPQVESVHEVIEQEETSDESMVDEAPQEEAIPPFVEQDESIVADAPKPDIDKMLTESFAEEQRNEANKKPKDEPQLNSEE